MQDGNVARAVVVAVARAVLSETASRCRCRAFGATGPQLRSLRSSAAAGTAASADRRCRPQRRRAVRGRHRRGRSRPHVRVDGALLQPGRALPAKRPASPTGGRVRSGARRCRSAIASATMHGRHGRSGRRSPFPARGDFRPFRVASPGRRASPHGAAWSRPRLKPDRPTAAGQQKGAPQIGRACRTRPQLPACDRSAIRTHPGTPP